MNISELEYKWMVEQIVSDMIVLLIEREGYEFTRAFETVYASDTYQAREVSHRLKPMGFLVLTNNLFVSSA